MALRNTLDAPLLLGSHLSVAGGLSNALLEAKRLEMGCVQVFTRNQRQWSAKPITEEERRDWLAALRDLGWLDETTGSVGARVVSHNSYLVNMASPDAATRERSIEAQRAELERCEALRIPLCVMHPGAHLDPAGRPGGASKPPAPPAGTPTPAELAGLRRVAEALDRLHRELPGFHVRTLLETTAGTGTNLGYDFAHLAIVRDLLREPERVGFCFDTCHVVAAGYPMASAQDATETWQRWDATCGLGAIRAFHLNDSVGACGSRTDRHAHIGLGACGDECFRAVVNQPRFRGVPMILETPKGEDARGRNWDLVNIERLRGLVGSASVLPQMQPSQQPSQQPTKQSAKLKSKPTASPGVRPAKKPPAKPAKKPPAKPPAVAIAPEARSKGSGSPRSGSKVAAAKRTGVKQTGVGRAVATRARSQRSGQ